MCGFFFGFFFLGGGTTLGHNLYQFKTDQGFQKGGGSAYI